MPTDSRGPQHVQAGTQAARLSSMKTLTVAAVEVIDRAVNRTVRGLTLTNGAARAFWAGRAEQATDRWIAHNRRVRIMARRLGFAVDAKAARL